MNLNEEELKDYRHSDGNLKLQLHVKKQNLTERLKEALKENKKLKDQKNKFCERSQFYKH